MNKLIQRILALLLIITVKSAQAFSFNPGDLLLVFHDAGSPPSASDVEYDLGSVSNLLNKTAGTKIALFTDTNSDVLNNFGSYTAARVILVAADDPSGGTGGKSIWMSTVNLASPVTFFSAGSSSFGNIEGRINQAGVNGAANSTSNPYIPNGVSDNNGYSYTAFGGAPSTSLGVGTFGSKLATASRTDGTNNGTMPFYQVAFSSSSTMTGQLVGTIFWNTNGTVTFTAGSAVVTPPPLIPATITHVQPNGSSNQIFFTSTNNNHYQLLYTTSLMLPVVWHTNVAAGTVTGNNSITNLSDTTTDVQRFYRIQSF